MISVADKRWLLRRLRYRLQELLLYRDEGRPVPHGVPSVWRQVGGMFVTLEVGNQVRGCSGSLSPRLPQRWQEAEDALRRALHDTRYRPIQRGELTRVRISVTVVYRLEPLEDIRLLGGAEQGLVLQTPDGHQGVVLPYEGRNPIERLRWAYRKAGAAEGTPAQIYCLHAERFGE